MKEFTGLDLDWRDPLPSSPPETKGYYRLSVDREKELVRKLLYFHRHNLMETASGYGHKLTSEWMIHFDGRMYRIYVFCISNNGTCWIQTKKYGRIIING